MDRGDRLTPAAPQDLSRRPWLDYSGRCRRQAVYFTVSALALVAQTQITPERLVDLRPGATKSAIR